ncbi:hypothetical protein OAP04_04005 [Pelagibacteraceae bacterium]|nr:hypothetical protein [Pelagibacteraceae bacterium]
MKKKKKNRDNGLKIGGAVIALVLIIHWGNVFFKAKDTFKPQPKHQSQSTPKQQSKSTTKFPLLRCEINNPDGSVHKEFYDLEKINNKNPLKDMSKDEAKKYLLKKDAEFTTFVSRDERYTIIYRNHENGIQKNFHVFIKKDTGELEMVFPKHISVNASLSDKFDAFFEGRKFYGECSEVKRKNL